MQSYSAAVIRVHRNMAGGLLAGTGVIMSLSAALAHGNLFWAVGGVAACATGLGAYLAMPATKKNTYMFRAEPGHHATAICVDSVGIKCGEAARQGPTQCQPLVVPAQSSTKIMPDTCLISAA